jgi:hypothetical protein
MKTPVEIKINNNREKIFYLEEGEYYLGRVDVGHYRHIKEKFGEDDDYKFAIYLFRKNEYGYLDIVDIISKGNFNTISRYHFKITVDDLGNVLVSIGDYRPEKPTYNAIYIGTAPHIFNKEKLSADKYLDLLVGGCNKTHAVKIRLGIVNPIEIIGPARFSKKDKILKYRIRTRIKEIMDENRYAKSLYECIKYIAIEARHIDGNPIHGIYDLNFVKLDDDVEITLYITKEKEFYFKCYMIKEPISIKKFSSKYVCPSKDANNSPTKIFSISLDDLI